MDYDAQSLLEDVPDSFRGEGKELVRSYAVRNKDSEDCFLVALRALHWSNTVVKGKLMSGRAAAIAVGKEMKMEEKIQTNQIANHHLLLYASIRYNQHCEF